MKFIIILILLSHFLLISDFYEDLFHQGIIIPLVGAVIGTIVSIIIKSLYRRIKKKSRNNSSDSYGRYGKKGR